jgi:hypothetical protein
MVISVMVQWVDTGSFRSASGMGAIQPDLSSFKLDGSLGLKPTSKCSSGWLNRRLPLNWTSGQLNAMDSSLRGLVRGTGDATLSELDDLIH